MNDNNNKDLCPFRIKKDFEYGLHLQCTREITNFLPCIEEKCAMYNGVTHFCGLSGRGK